MLSYYYLISIDFIEKEAFVRMSIFRQSNKMYGNAHCSLLPYEKIHYNVYIQKKRWEYHRAW